LLGDDMVATVLAGSLFTLPVSSAPPGQELASRTTSSGTRLIVLLLVMVMVSADPESSPDALRAAAHTEFSVFELVGDCPQV
jgi:hypothetical protein